MFLMACLRLAPRRREDRIERRVPQMNAADHAVGVWRNLHVARQVEIDQTRIAAAEIKSVEIHQGAHDRDRLAQPAVPSMCTFLVGRRVTEILIVCLAFEQWMLAELEMWQQTPVLEQRRSDARTEREHAFEAISFDGAKSLNIRIVEYARRLP